MINYFIFIYSFLIIFYVHDSKVDGKSHLRFLLDQTFNECKTGSWWLLRH